MQEEKALRYDDGKLRWRNFPMFLIRPLIQQAQFGEGKYDTYNFLKGAPINQYLDCIKRHLDKFEDPFLPDNDPDSNGINHLAAVAWNALVALYMVQNRPDLDDRWKPSDKLTDATTTQQTTPFEMFKYFSGGDDILADPSCVQSDGTNIANEDLKP